jgi:hypothetical protein
VLAAIWANIEKQAKTLIVYWLKPHWPKKALGHLNIALRRNFTLPRLSSFGVTTARPR